MDGQSPSSERYNAVNRPSVVCAGCGAIIVNPGRNQRHCDSKCRTLALRKRLREMIINRHLNAMAKELAERKLGPYVPGMREE